MKPSKTSIRAKRRTRLLPRELRSLDALVELTNLISQAEFERFYGAYLRLFEKEYGARSEKRQRAEELTSFMEEFSVRYRTPEHCDAMTTLLKCIGMGTFRPDEAMN